MRGAKIEFTVKLIEQIRRHRHLLDNATPPALKHFEADDAGIQFKRSRRYGEHFRNAVANPPQG